MSDLELLQVFIEYFEMTERLMTTQDDQVAYEAECHLVQLEAVLKKELARRQLMESKE